MSAVEEFDEPHANTIGMDINEFAQTVEAGCLEPKPAVGPLAAQPYIAFGAVALGSRRKFFQAPKED